MHLSAYLLSKISEAVILKLTVETIILQNGAQLSPTAGWRWGLGGFTQRGTAPKLIDYNRHDEDSVTYVSSISIASMGLGGSMPRPEGRDLCH